MSQARSLGTVRTGRPHRWHFARVAWACGVIAFAVAWPRPAAVRESSEQHQLALSTYVGGSRLDQIRDIATDGEGNIYVVGGTESPDFMVTAGSLQTVHNPGNPESRSVSRFDVFVTKLSPSGSVVWSTLLGGPNYDRAYAVEVDRTGHVYVAGRAGRGFPVTAGAFQTSFSGGSEAPFYGEQDGFLCKIKPDASAIVFCSYFGTSDHAIIRDIAVDPEGAVYLAAGYVSGRYPRDVQRAFINRPAGGKESVVAKVTADGSRVVWAAYVGGGGDEGLAPSLRVDQLGNPVLLTTTRSSDAPTSADAYDRSYNGGLDFYVTKWRGNGAGMMFGTYLGGAGDETLETHNLELDAAGHVIIGAQSTSLDFPTTPGAYQRTHQRGRSSTPGRRAHDANDGVVAKLSADGRTLVASTFYGGRQGDAIEGIAADASGHIYVTGGTHSDDLPLSAHPFQSSPRGHGDAFFAKFSPDLGTLLFATYIGGTAADEGRAAAVAPAGGAYLAGQTSSRDWPTAGARRSLPGGGTDGMVAGFLPALAPAGQRPLRLR